MAAAETVPSGGISTQRLRLSAINILKDFNGIERDVDRGRSWIWQSQVFILPERESRCREVDKVRRSANGSGIKLVQPTRPIDSP